MESATRVFYSASTNGFYDSALFGLPEIEIPDPDWVRPTISITLQPGEHVELDGQLVHNDADEPLTLDIPEYSATPPMLVVQNPNCTLPMDAQEIDHEWHQELLSGMSQNYRIGPDEHGLPVLVAAPGPTLEQQLVNALATIDHTADTARALVVGDPLRAEEYKTAREEAQVFAAGGYQGDVPRAVAAWAINGRTAQQAADEILAEAAAWTEALYFIRETRLAAKEQVRELMAAEQPEQAQAAAEQAIAAINAAIAGVGNASNS